MPFTIGGEWIPSTPKIKKPIKISLVRKRGKVVTLLQNLPLSSPELVDLLSFCKKKWGCGGTLNDEEIELQGDKVELVKKLLEEKQIK